MIPEEVRGFVSRAGFPRILDGGIVYDFYLPVRAGDILVASVIIQDISEKQGKTFIAR